MKTPIVLFLLALVIRLAVILFWQFDGLYGQDPYAYYQQAIAIRQNLPQGAFPPVDFFWPNGYPLLIALFTLIVGVTPLAGQLVSLLSGVLVVLLVCLLSWDLTGFASGAMEDSLLTIRKLSGPIAALIIVVAGQPILSSVVIMADMPALFWATLAAWCVVRATRATRRTDRNTPALWFLAAGAALALAIITRWIYVLIVPTLGLYTLFQIYHNKIRWWISLPAVLSGALVLTPQIWLSLNKPDGLFHSFLLGWRPLNIFLRHFETVDGHAAYQLPVGLFYAQPLGHPAYIFPLLGLAALWGTWRLWQARQWPALILLLGWAAPVYLFLAGIPFQNFRFGLSLYPPLVILTGFGLSDLLNRAARAQRRKETLQRSSGQARAQRRKFQFDLRNLPPGMILKGVILLSLLGMLAWAYLMLDNFLTTHNQSKLLARRVEQALPPQATLLTFGLTLTFQHYTELDTRELFYFDAASLQSLSESRTAFYLLLDLQNIESQWQGRAPQLNYEWLAENTDLVALNRFPPYILFKVVPHDY